MSSRAHTLTETLEARYGAILTIDMLADVLHRPSEALRQWLNKSNEPVAETLRKARRRVGRRSYFVTSEIAQIIENESRAE